MTQNLVANFSPGETLQILPRLIVVRRQLLQELLDAVLLAHRVDVGNLGVGQRREVEVDLQREMERTNDDDGKLVI